MTTGLNVIRRHKRQRSTSAIAVPFGTINPMKLPMVPAGSNGVQHFHSRPDLEPASVTVNKHSSSAYNGDIFVTPQYGPDQDGPMILDPSGNMIWFQPVPANELATDFRVQQLGGQPVLTWWQGFTNNGSGRGEGVIYNTQVPADRDRPGGEWAAGHGPGRVPVTPRPMPTSSASRPSTTHGMGRPLMDAVVQEIDIKTGLGCSSGTRSTTSRSLSRSSRRARRKLVFDP